MDTIKTIFTNIIKIDPLTKENTAIYTYDNDKKEEYPNNEFELLAGIEKELKKKK